MKFRTTILLGVMVLLGVVTTSTVGTATQVLESNARDSLAEALGRSDRVFQELKDYRSSLFESQVHVTSEEPRVKAVLANDEVNTATIVDVAKEVQGAQGSDLFLFTDPDGILLADTADPEASGYDMSKMPLIKQSIETGRAEGIWTDDTRAMQVQARQVQIGGSVIGVLVTGYAFDHVVAETVHRQTGASVILRHNDEVLAASALPEDLDESNETLVGAIQEFRSSEVPVEFDVGGRRYLVVGSVLEGYHGDGDVNYVIVRSLDEALEPARALIGRLYYIAMGALAFGILLTLGLARKLSGPIDKLVAFTRLISAGQLESRTDIKGPTEIADLGRSMNKMAGDLCDSRKKLEESKKKVEEINEHLEELVEERTRDLKVANAEISEMLDNLDAAVFIVDEQLRVVGRHSPACSEIFGIEDLEGKGLDEFLFMGDEHSDEDLSRHMFALRMSFGAPTFQFEMSQVNLMAKKEYEHPEKDEDEKQRTFEIRYAPLADEFDFVQRLLIVVSDLTEMLALEASIAAQAESADAKVNAIMEMASSQRDMCGDFVDEQVDRIVQIKNDMASWYSTREEESRSRFLRDLHTIKGNARALRLKGVSSLVHEIEGIVGEHIDADDGSDEFVEVVEQIQLLEARLTIYRETYDDFFRVGGDQGESSGAGALALGRVDARLEAISGLLDASSRSALDAMRSLTRDESSGKVSGMASTFAMHDPMVSEVSETLGKEVMPLSESSPEWELYVSPDLARAFRDATTHSVRNNLDHGLEDPDSREANGKDRQGRIWLDLAEQDEHFLLTIRDDGRGINTEKVLEAAKKRGALAANAPEPANDEEIIELLFQDDMSTKEEVTDVSGRGVGMGAVRQMLAEQRVETRLYNHPDGGAALELTISKEQVCYVDRSGSVQLIGGTDTSVQQVA